MTFSEVGIRQKIGEDGWKAERGERSEPAVQMSLYHFISHKSSRHDKAGAANMANIGGRAGERRRKER